ncbi:hypothetical protein EYC98_21260 [Halieaceae bacterium IMCC14734]|uniref:DUF3944 domain-containing protein n=1 Tax=Candidatus Litorirhabdus singularis TaxID=2518993 RepID=A0ABT3TM36_9GAMM|nr:hypothetical protein [Candidatus Litorirhabdus singularis]MCX2983396.1 hypothetical protein [Candidatus Litorirhabdus singularis]
METTFSEVLGTWDEQQLSNLAVLLELPPGNSSLASIEEQIKWLYHSKARAKVKSAFGQGAEFLKSVVAKEPVSQQVELEYKVPTYDELIYQAADKLKVNDGRPSLEEAEKYISHAVIIEALTKMSPRERIKFFETQVNLGAVVDKGNNVDGGLKGPISTLAALGAAQAGGFSLYVASTTALGFVTHAVGVTLPFAVYTGMTSTIAFVIGPAGWLAAGTWLAWNATGPEWKKLIPVLLYIIVNRSATELGLESAGAEEPRAS